MEECLICGAEVPIKKENVYLAIIRHDSQRDYIGRVIDCPNCGCQKLLQGVMERTEYDPAKKPEKEVEEEHTLHPLPLEKVKQMDGETVFISVFAEIHIRWGTVCLKNDVILNNAPGGLDSYPLSKYGKDFVVYRKK